MEEAVRIGVIRSANEIQVTSKIGFLPDRSTRDRLIKAGILHTAEIVGRHALSPGYILFQLRSTLDQLGIDKLKVVFLHNPEVQLEHITRTQFETRVRASFDTLEQACADGLSDVYGVASWSGFGEGAARTSFTVNQLVALAYEVAGPAHRFQAIQLPVSLVRVESVAGALKQTPMGPLAEACSLGMAVYASSPLHGSALPPLMGPELIRLCGNSETAAQACLLFARSAPGMHVVLTSPSSTEHVKESLLVSSYPRLDNDQLRRIVTMLL